MIKKIIEKRKEINIQKQKEKEEYLHNLLKMIPKTFEEALNLLKELQTYNKAINLSKKLGLDTVIPTIKNEILKNKNSIYNLNDRYWFEQDNVLAKEPVIVLVPDGSKDYYSYGQNKNDRKQALEIMKNAGIINLSDFVKEKNIKMARNTILGEVAVRYLGWGEKVTQMNLCDLDENCIRIPKEFLEGTTIKELQDSLQNSELSKYAIFKDQKKFEETESITLDEFVKNTENISFETSKGSFTANQIIKYEGESYEYVAFWTDDKDNPFYNQFTSLHDGLMKLKAWQEENAEWLQH